MIIMDISTEINEKWVRLVLVEQIVMVQAHSINSVICFNDLMKRKLQY